MKIYQMGCQKVGNMSYMFSEASNFNQDIGSWNVGKVTDMGLMFNLANNFNQDLNNWDVSKVITMLICLIKQLSLIIILKNGM